MGCAPLPPSGPGRDGGEKGTATSLPGGPRRDAPPEREVRGAYTSGSTASGARAGADAAPGHEFDAHAVPDAVPRDEPRSRYGNKSPYMVFGKTYTVMDDATGFTERGVASWYGAKFHGAKTSSGEPYDMYAMSAAHKSLPLPSYARVTNLETGATVVVRVNDRGPFKDDRVMDLSYAAATRLGITAKGTGLVEIRVVGPGDVAAVPPDGPTVTVIDDGGIGEAVPYFGEELAPAPAPAPAPAIAPVPVPAPAVVATAASKPPIAPLTADDMALKAPVGAAPALKPAPTVSASKPAPVAEPPAVAAPKPAPSAVVPAVAATATAPAVAARKPAPKAKSRKPPPTPKPRKPAPAAATPEAPGYEVVAVANPFSPPSPSESAAAAKPVATPPTMWLQVGAFGDEANANRVRVRLAASGLPTATKTEKDATGKKLFKIRVGPFHDAADIAAATKSLDAAGLKGSTTVIE
jgi:rare lipoprotein A